MKIYNKTFLFFIFCIIGLKHSHAQLISIPQNFESIPFQYIGTRNKFIIVKMNINGYSNKDFIFDTGTNISLVINKKYYSSMNIAPGSKKVIASPSHQAYISTLIKKVSFDNSHFKLSHRHKFIWKNVKGIIGYTISANIVHLKNRKIYGIIGSHLFAHCVFQINYNKKLLTLYNPHYFHINLNLFDKYSALHMQKYNSGHLFHHTISVIINHSIFNLSLDTGSTNLYIRSSFAHLLDIKAAYPIYENLPFKNKMAEALIPNIQLQKYKLLDIPTLIGEYTFATKTSNVANTNNFIHSHLSSVTSIKYGYKQGSIGNMILSKFNPIFDYEDNLLYIYNSKPILQNFILGYTGLHYTISHNNILCDSIDPDSPANQAGLKTSDIIIRINNMNVKSMTRREIKQILNSPPNTKLNLLVQHKNKIIHVNIKCISKFDKYNQNSIIQNITGRYISPNWDKKIIIKHVQSYCILTDGAVIIYYSRPEAKTTIQSIILIPRKWKKVITFKTEAISFLQPNGTIICVLHK